MYKRQCQGYVTKEEYAISVKGAIDFLNGDYEQTIKAVSYTHLFLHYDSIKQVFES